jgi:hypothetical protein
MDGATVDRCPDVPDPRGGVHVEQSHCDRVLEHLPESAEQIVSRQRRQLLRLANFEAHNPDEHEKISDPFSAQGGDTRAGRGVSVPRRRERISTRSTPSSNA